MTQPEAHPEHRGEDVVSPTVTSDNAASFGSFSEHRKTATTRISDFTMPPGTTYQTPEGLRAEDEETRIAFDVQGGVYPIRESVFRASYAAALPSPETTPAGVLPDREARAAEIATGLAEIGTGGTPAFIRGYNRGYDDAYEHAASGEGTLRDAAYWFRAMVRAGGPDASDQDEAVTQDLDAALGDWEPDGVVDGWPSRWREPRYTRAALVALSSPETTPAPEEET